MRLSKLENKKIKFMVHNLKYEGLFLGIGKKKGTSIVGLLFDNVLEAMGTTISSLMLVHPDDIVSNDMRSKALVIRAKEILRNHKHSKNDDLYFPKHQIKILAFPQRQETVLVVDNEPSIREILFYELQELGYCPIIVSNVGEALRVLNNTIVDKIIIDLIMPQISGEDLMFNVIENHPDVDIVIISGHIDKLDALRKASKSRVCLKYVSVMDKPCSMNKLQIALNTCGIV